MHDGNGHLATLGCLVHRVLRLGPHRRFFHDRPVLHTGTRLAPLHTLSGSAVGRKVAAGRWWGSHVTEGESTARDAYLGQPQAAFTEALLGPGTEAAPSRRALYAFIPGASSPEHGCG